MKWAKTVKYQASISVEGEVFNILCENDFDDELAMSINGEYVCNIKQLPSHEDLVDYVSEQRTIEGLAKVNFKGEIR